MPSTARTPIYIGSDCRLELDEATLVTDDGTEVIQNAGTCTYQIKTVGGTLVTGAEGSLSYYAGSDGRYIVIIDKTITLLLARNQDYDVFVTFAQSGNDAVFLLPCKATYQ